MVSFSNLILPLVKLIAFPLQLFNFVLLLKLLDVIIDGQSDIVEKALTVPPVRFFN